MQQLLDVLDFRAEVKTIQKCRNPTQSTPKVLLRGDTPIWGNFQKKIDQLNKKLKVIVAQDRKIKHQRVC